MSYDVRRQNGSKGIVLCGISNTMVLSVQKRFVQTSKFYKIFQIHIRVSSQMSQAKFGLYRAKTDDAAHLPWYKNLDFWLIVALIIIIISTAAAIAFILIKRRRLARRNNRRFNNGGIL